MLRVSKRRESSSSSICAVDDHREHQIRAAPLSQQHTIAYIIIEAATNSRRCGDEDEYNEIDLTLGHQRLQRLCAMCITHYTPDDTQTIFIIYSLRRTHRRGNWDPLITTSDVGSNRAGLLL